MTLAGWLFMTLSIGFVVSLAAFCFHRVLTRRVAPADEHPATPGAERPVSQDSDGSVHGGG